jgi:hypothetical protein
MKSEQTGAPLLLFYSYAHEDEPLREELEKHLRMLSREGLISEWHDRKILAGAAWAQEIDAYLEAASIVLLLVSPDFLASDYCYEIEMQRALERHRLGLARVIPVILRPCDWQHTPFASLQCLPRNGQPVTTWYDQDEAFLDIAQGLRRVIEHIHPPAHPMPEVQRENRERLIKRVRATWIEGLLEHSLHHATWLDLGLQEQPDALDNPWDVLVQEMDTAPRPLPPGTSIVQVYDQADGRLLILGQPGMGKTTLLLQLTRTLLERAERDTLAPLPVVFVLSSWARKRQPLATWLAEELRVRYQVSNAIAQQWISGQHILPLLDGLDEVASNARVACVEAINTYIKEQLDQKHVPLVVSCRSQECANLATRVALQKAVSILPLSKEQVEKYLERGGKRVEAIRQALREDSTLAEMARTPLLLSVFVLAYLDAPLKELPLGYSREESLESFFTTYVRRMLRRRGVLRSGSRKQAIEWLTFLAKQMQRYNQTVFSVETLQADGLSKRQEIVYTFSYPLRIGLLFFLVVGLITGLGNGLTDQYGFGTGMGDGLGFGALIAFFAMLFTLIRPVETLAENFRLKTRSSSAPPTSRPSWIIRPKEVLTLDWSWKAIRFGLLCGLVPALLIGLLLIPGGFVLAFSTELAAIIMIPIARAVSKSRSFQRIPLRLKEDWSRIWRKYRFWLLGALAAVLAFLIAITPASRTAALIIGLPVWMIASVLKIAAGSPLLDRTYVRPNEGIRRSGRNGLILGLIVTCGLALPINLVSWLYFHTSISITLFELLIGLTTGLAFGLYFGLDAYLQHFFLRFWLWLLDALPWKIVSFLDEMAERILLRRIGGSYIFVHRYLLDYFAALTPARQNDLAENAKAGTLAQAFRKSALQPRKIFNKRWYAALTALTCLFLISWALITNIQQARKDAFDQNATATAQNQQFDALVASKIYPAAFPGHGRILRFSSLQRNDIMTLADDPAQGCYAQKDGYHISHQKADSASFCAYGDRLSDVAIRVNLTILHGDCGGITFRSDPATGSSYFFYVCQRGVYGLFRNNPGASATALIHATPVPGGLRRTNSIAVVALGSALTLFINGRQIAAIQDNHYTQGVSGFAAFALRQPTEVVYSDVRIWMVQP